MWLGKGKHFLTFPVRAGKLINYVGFVPADEEMKESWSAPGDPDVLRREFAGWDPRIETLLSQVAKDVPLGAVRPRAAADLDQGRLTLLGDAAHPMLPHLGQGANQSIEDGMALATILARRDRAGVPAALLAYERLRRERVAEVQRGARENGMRYDSSYADLGVRDAEITAHAAFRKTALRSRRGAGSASRGGCLELNGRYVATVVNRAITLSTVDAGSCARPKFAHSLYMRHRCGDFVV